MEFTVFSCVSLIWTDMYC